MKAYFFQDYIKNHCSRTTFLNLFGKYIKHIKTFSCENASESTSYKMLNLFIKSSFISFCNFLVNYIKKKETLFTK